MVDHPIAKRNESFRRTAFQDNPDRSAEHVLDAEWTEVGAKPPNERLPIWKSFLLTLRAICILVLGVLALIGVLALVVPMLPSDDGPLSISFSPDMTMGLTEPVDAVRVELPGTISPEQACIDQEMNGQLNTKLREFVLDLVSQPHGIEFLDRSIDGDLTTAQRTANEARFAFTAKPTVVRVTNSGVDTSVVCDGTLRIDDTIRADDGRVSPSYFLIDPFQWTIRYPASVVDGMLLNGKPAAENQEDTPSANSDPAPVAESEGGGPSVASDAVAVEVARKAAEAAGRKADAAGEAADRAAAQAYAAEKDQTSRSPSDEDLYAPH